MSTFAQAAIPALTNLNVDKLASTGVYFVHGGTEELKPWNLSFTERVELDSKQGGYKHVVHITASGGAVNRQNPMLAALNKRFNPVFKRLGWTSWQYSGELFTTCRDHTMSTLQWKVWKAHPDRMPPGGVPTDSMMPGGSVGDFLKMALGKLPVDLAGVKFSWRPNPYTGVGTIAETNIILEQMDSSAPAVHGGSSRTP